MRTDFRQGRSNLITILVIIVFVALIFITGCIDLDGSSQTSKDKMSKVVEEGYASVNDYSAIMITTSVKEDGKRRKTSTKVWFKKPLKYRYEHLSPNDIKNDLTVVNGDRMWVYDSSENTVRTLNQTPSNRPSAGYGKQVLTILRINDVEILRSEVIDGRDCYVIRITPRDNKRMEGKIYRTIWLDKEYGFPVRMIARYQGYDKASYTIQYRELRFNNDIPNNKFRFQMPEGASIIARDGQNTFSDGNTLESQDVSSRLLAE